MSTKQENATWRTIDLLWILHNLSLGQLLLARILTWYVKVIPVALQFNVTDIVVIKLVHCKLISHNRCLCATTLCCGWSVVDFVILSLLTLFIQDRLNLSHFNSAMYVQYGFLNMSIYNEINITPSAVYNLASVFSMSWTRMGFWVDERICMTYRSI